MVLACRRGETEEEGCCVDRRLEQPTPVEALCQRVIYLSGLLVHIRYMYKLVVALNIISIEAFY